MAPCTVVGLSSARGQKLNGSVGVVKVTGNEASTERVAVILDGQNDPVSIKLENLELFVESSSDGCALVWLTAALTKILPHSCCC
jgi:hypothetical protein